MKSEQRPETKSEWLDQITSTGQKYKKRDRTWKFIGSGMAVALVAAVSLSVISVAGNDDTKNTNAIKETKSVKAQSVRLQLPGDSEPSEFKLRGDAKHAIVLVCVDKTFDEKADDNCLKLTFAGETGPGYDAKCQDTINNGRVYSMSEIEAIAVARDIKGELYFKLQNSESGTYEVNVLQYDCETREAINIFSKRVDFTQMNK